MGYTQEQLAEKMFVPKTTISTYERDAYKIGKSALYNVEKIDEYLEHFLEEE